MLMRKDQALEKFPKITTGMPVYDHENRRLGRVVALSEDALTVEKGIFFPKDFTLRYEQIEACREGRVFISKPTGERVSLSLVEGSPEQPSVQPTEGATAEHPEQKAEHKHELKENEQPTKKAA